MFSFLAKHPPSRTKTCRLNELTLDNGLSTVEFQTHAHSRSYRFLNRLPQAVSDAEAKRRGLSHKGANSSLAPPLHRHLWQQETFHVLQGTARFTIGRKPRERTASAGEIVTIPKCEAHTFCNASEEEGLVVEFMLDPASRETDEAYFRNVWSYRDDCRKAGMQRSIFQSLLFMHRGGVVMVLPGPEVISRFVALALNHVGGVLIGKWLLGYQDSYPEYYSGDPSSHVLRKST